MLGVRVCVRLCEFRKTFAKFGGGGAEEKNEIFPISNESLAREPKPCPHVYYHLTLPKA